VKCRRCRPSRSLYQVDMGVVLSRGGQALLGRSEADTNRQQSGIHSGGIRVDYRLALSSAGDA
jgi:hypothetical protein